MRHNAAGDKLSLELMTTAGNRTRETVQQVLQSQWRKLGVEVRMRNEPARVMFGETMRERQFAGMAMFAWISAPENVPRLTLHSEEIPRPENDFAGQNHPGFGNAEADGSSTASRSSSTAKRRRRCGAACRRSTPRSCRCCRSISAPTATSCRNGWPASSRPGT